MTTGSNDCLSQERNKVNFLQTLKRCELFIGLDDKDLEKVAGLSSWRRSTFKAGEYIFKENSEAEDFHIIEEGAVNLCLSFYDEKTKKVTQKQVDTITQGNVFGWSALVAPRFLTMSAISVKSSSILMVNGVQLTELMDHEPALGYEIMKGIVRVLSLRLRELRLRLINKDEITASPHETPDG
jgi:CRP/FNR family cyclic AMP-dependent transcriptional regulator